jgi:hypothetical protein
MFYRIVGTLACTLLLGIGGIAGADDEQDAKRKQNLTYTDPDEAGPDFAVQGEYGGVVAALGTRRPSGAHVIALGGGKFDLVIYPGGLPGRGWDQSEGRQKGSGESSTNDEGRTTVRFKGDEWTATIEGGVLTLQNNEGMLFGKLEKVTRKSTTLEARPPEGAVILFDGTTADNFENGKMTSDLLLMADCTSKEKFGDHTLHVEFRTPFKPYARGQARGNSGVYVQSRYEVQVLDSFGLEGKNNECGGIYSIAEPKVNMCFPPLTWQTFDIDFTAARYDSSGKKTQNARVTIKHNGVVIHDDLELPHGTPGKAPEGPEPAGVYLQGHGNPVVFRNIWAVKK